MKRCSITIFAIFIVGYILPLGVRPLVMPDETRYAEIPREMLHTGDWIVPRLDGLRYFEKPVLGYWLNAISIELFGENAFAVRLPSALAVGLTALLIFFLVRRLGSGKLIALSTATIFFTFGEVVVVGVTCVLDSMFSLFVTAAIISFYFAYMADNSRKKAIYLALFGVGCGLAFLTKGFIAFAVPFVTIIPFLIWNRQSNGLWRLVWIPILTSIVVNLPWSVMIHLRENDFWRYFFWEEHLRRFFSDHAQHAEPFWYFIPVIVGGAMPWTAVLPVIAAGLRRIQPKDSFVRFTLCWLVFPFLFFSVCRGKLGTYILPCFPPLAILIALGLTKYFALGNKKVFNTILRLGALLAIIAAGALILIHTALPGVSLYSNEESCKWILLSVGLLVYAISLMLASGNIEYMNRLCWCCFGLMCLVASAQFATPDRLKAGKMPGEFLLRHSEQIEPDAIIVSDNYLTPAVCWYYQRDDLYLLGRTGEFTYGIGYDDAHHRSVALADFTNFVQKNGKDRPVVLITKSKRYDEYRKLLPNPAKEIRKCGFVLAEFASTKPTQRECTSCPAKETRSPPCRSEGVTPFDAAPVSGFLFVWLLEKLTEEDSRVMPKPNGAPPTSSAVCANPRWSR